tara:strand:+ start:445 stop:822 length:378 start_codon:yes stop_codon:yes gene_type:complete
MKQEERTRIAIIVLFALCLIAKCVKSQTTVNYEFDKKIWLCAPNDTVNGFWTGDCYLVKNLAQNYNDTTIIVLETKQGLQYNITICPSVKRSINLQAEQQKNYMILQVESVRRKIFPDEHTLIAL